MIFDVLTVSAIVIAVILIVFSVMLTRHKAHTDKKIHNMARQFHLIQRNDKAKAYLKSICEKHPELCAGIDFTIVEKDDHIEIDEWHSKHPRPEASE